MGELDEAEHSNIDAILDEIDARWGPLLDRLARHVGDVPLP